MRCSKKKKKPVINLWSSLITYEELEKEKQTESKIGRKKEIIQDQSKT